jgi:hypothetical protein
MSSASAFARSRASPSGVEYSAAIASSAARNSVVSSLDKICAEHRAEACALLAATSCESSRQSNPSDRCHCSNSASSGSRKRPDHIFTDCCSPDIALRVPRILVFRATVQLRQFAAFAEREQAARSIGKQFLARVRDIEVAHCELADAVAWREGGLGLLHA